MIKCNYIDPKLNNLLSQKLITTQEWAICNHIVSDIVGGKCCLSQKALVYLQEIVNEKISI